MNTQRSPPAFRKHVKISTRLRRFYGAKSIFLSGHGKIGGIIARDLQKDATVRAALVSLSGRVQEARSKAETCRDLLLVTHNVSEFLQHLFVFGVHCDVGERGEVIARACASEMRFQHVD